MHPSRRSLAVAVLASSLAMLAHSALAIADSRVAVATSGDHSELVERLPVARGDHAPPRVVMSMPLKRVGGLERGDAVAISAELQLTTDCDAPGGRCIGDPYHYNPRVTTYAVLASSPHAVGGETASIVADPKPQICRQAKPNREHHCVLVRETSPRRVGAGEDCIRTRCFVNLVAVASSPRAHRGEFVAVGGLRPNGSVPQDRGRLNVIRTSPAGTVKHRTAIDSRLDSTELGLEQNREVVFARRMRGLERDEQLVVSAKARVDITDLPYNVVLSSQLIVTDRRGDVVRGVGASFVSSRGELGEGNGFNCTQNRGRCMIRKVGVLTVQRSLRTRSGKPIPLFVSLVTRAGPKHFPASPGDRVTVRTGSVRVLRYPSSASLSGRGR